jgi:MiaB-like tRNA modifying enzyme
MKKFHVATLGCKVNQHETQAIVEAWQSAGLALTEDPGLADVVLCNTCLVTANAERDVRQLVRRLHRANPAARIVVTGCAAETMRRELAGLPGVARVVAQPDKAALLSGPDGEPEALRREAFPAFRIRGYRRARPVLKVQDGCSHGCTFCVVPLTRGRSVSRPLADILAEARRLLDAGFRELVLAGVNLAHFGRDLPGGPDFWDLLALFEREFSPDWSGRARLRISSVEPGQLNGKALETLAGSRLICPHLHLSLQSGDAQVLRRMGRGHARPGAVLEFVERLGRVWPAFGLGADLLVGFPGETEAQFAATLDFCRGLPLTYAHVFPYSPRPGTKAASMPDQVPDPLKRERAARLRGLAGERKRRFLQRLCGLPVLRVLVEEASGRGVSEHYAPCRVAGPAASGLVAGRPVGVVEGRVLVEPVWENA